MYDRLPNFGLVRAGVAPDHQKDKSVQKAYDKSAQLPTSVLWARRIRFRYQFERFKKALPSGNVLTGAPLIEI